MGKVQPNEKKANGVNDSVSVTQVIVNATSQDMNVEAEIEDQGMPMESYLTDSESGAQTKEAYFAHLLKAQQLGPKLLTVL